MEKKRKIIINSHSQSQESYFVEAEMKTTAATENVFTKDDLFTIFDGVILTDKTEEKSAKGTKKTSE